VNTIIAPEIYAQQWHNSDPLSIASLRGKVVAVHAFQMLCPSCISHGLPQASAIHELYASDQVQVIGLHSVFEHHSVMTPEALKVFIHEYRLGFPIAIDQPVEHGPIPKTMAAYQLQGTPSLVLIDRAGRIRLNHTGRVNDMQVGNAIGQLLKEAPVAEDAPVQKAASAPAATHAPSEKNTDSKKSERCNSDHCSI
tara:strand:- start:34178 stop:34765 length:588 start_codon:yes stop_codon:yes gene_type:complete